MKMRRLALYLHSISPEILSLFKKGYSLSGFYKDIYSGFLVAVISFPLAMALAIASGASPEKGLITSVVAGFFTSLFGGCKYQIGGPTGAFVVIIFNIIQNYGYEALLVAGFMAGIILMIAGFLKIGKIIEYIPYTVTAGFTAGIGITIFSTQLHDLFGITNLTNSGDFIKRSVSLFSNIEQTSFYALLIGLSVIAIIFLLQKYKPSYPRFLIALLIGVLSVLFMPENALETIGGRFKNMGDVTLSMKFPAFSFDLFQAMFPSAITIAFLSGIESLLCAVVADSLTSTKHKSDSELIGQGLSNVISSIFGGIPSTGALARTAANIKAGAVSSFSGIYHALFVGLFMYFLLDYMKFVPIACLSGILITVAWNMVSFKQCAYIFHSSASDIAVFFTTLILTVIVDITVAVEAGVLISGLLFIKRIAQRTEIEISHISGYQPELSKEKSSVPDQICNNIQCINIKGPLFFGLVPTVKTVLKRVLKTPEILILNFAEVPLIDATGAKIISQFVSDAKGVPVILTNLRKYPYEYLKHLDYKKENICGYITQNMSEAIKLAENLLISSKK